MRCNKRHRDKGCMHTHTHTVWSDSYGGPLLAESNIKKVIVTFTSEFISHNLDLFFNFEKKTQLEFLSCNSEF